MKNPRSSTRRGTRWTTTPWRAVFEPYDFTAERNLSTMADSGKTGEGGTVMLAPFPHILRGAAPSRWRASLLRCIFCKTIKRLGERKGGRHLSSNPLFATKSMARLMEEMKGENRLRRILGPVQLTSLGVGATIGTGIFVLTGQAAHDKTGPALMLSFVFSGIACIFAALCYAEFASMVPVAGSAYTYAYATLGELFAWIIGWDLILEYAVGSATVAHGWSHYFQDLLKSFGVHIPYAFANAPFDYNLDTGQFFATGAYFDVPAIVITAIITGILVYGIRESARINAGMVIVKLGIVLFVICLLYTSP